MGLKDAIITELIRLAEECGIQKLILFGSRARGDYKERSDIDLAICGGNVLEFMLNIDDEIPTLLLFDVVNLDGSVQAALLDSIEKEGITLYEKI